MLTHLRVSPFPALVIGLEGATEYKLVPRVMETLGIQWDHNRIRIVDGGGTWADLSLLARYAVEPVIGRDLGDHVVLDRPLTRFLIMTDAENKYRTPADRRYQRKLLLDSLTKNVPQDLAGQLLHQHAPRPDRGHRDLGQAPVRVRSLHRPGAGRRDAWHRQGAPPARA